MMRWTAMVPLKLGSDRKSRLASILTLERRHELVEQMAKHVFTALAAVESVDEIVMIASCDVHQWPVRHFPDRGRGLNGELGAAARTIGSGLLVIHGDLPCVEAEEIATLLAAAESSGFAIAPDRHREGTNALALRHVPPGFAFAFGENSFAAHRALLGGKLAIVDRVGLACDIDTPADFELAVSRGCLNGILTA
jgi:2-phospho-L-lactate/phosphoenolpyruvate guanylyltransferase